MKELVKPRKSEEIYSSVQAFCDMKYDSGKYASGYCQGGGVYSDAETNGDDILF